VEVPELTGGGGPEAEAGDEAGQTADLAACHFPVLPDEDLTVERSALTGVGGREELSLGHLPGRAGDGT
jgi:hypothetical protein